MTAFNFPQWVTHAPALSPQPKDEAEAAQIEANRKAWAEAQQKVADEFATAPVHAAGQRVDVDGVAIDAETMAPTFAPEAVEAAASEPKRRGWPKGKPRK